MQILLVINKILCIDFEFYSDQVKYILTKYKQKIFLKQWNFSLFLLIWQKPAHWFCLLICSIYTYFYIYLWYIYLYIYIYIYNFTVFKGKYLSCSLFLIKNLEKRLRHKCVPADFVKLETYNKNLLVYDLAQRGKCYIDDLKPI